MKIPELIIEKYKLKPSSAHTGEAVLHNLLLFTSELPELDGVIFMECDHNGRPSPYINFYNRETKQEGSLTPEFMQVADMPALLKIVS